MFIIQKIKGKWCLGFCGVGFGCCGCVGGGCGGACKEIFEMPERIFSTWNGKRFLLVCVKIVEGAWIDWRS